MMSQGSPLHLMVAMEEIKRLRALLPHTADGKQIEVGEWYYCLKSGGAVQVQVTKIVRQMEYDYWWCEIARSGFSPRYDLHVPDCDLYSTKSAALVAQEEKR